MKKIDKEKFRAILEEQKQTILQKISTRKASDYTIKTEDIKDEVDHASAEADNSLSMHLLDRERMLFTKINVALQKIDSNNFGYCEECSDEIEPKRLLARPVTTLCITCKEEQEKTHNLY